MKRAQRFVLATWFLFAAGVVEPAQAVINSYRQILTGATYSVAAAPGALYAGVVNGVKKSVDQGATWIQLPGMTSKTNGLAVDPKNAGTVYAATTTGLFRSVDAGTTWTLLNADVRYFVTVSPFDSAVLFADNLKSADGGLSWRTMTTWSTYYNAPVSLPKSQSLSLRCSSDPANPGFMLASVNETSYRSVDGGETWQYFWDDVDSVAIDPADARYFYLGGRCGREILRYYPQGNAWVGPDHVHGLAVDPDNHGRVFAVTDDGTAAFSANFGATWRSDTFPRIPYIYNGNTYYRIFVPFEGRTIFDAATGMVLSAGTEGLLAKNSRCADGDNDGYSPEGGVCGPVDCDDASTPLNPGIRENCLDAVDNNCDGNVDMADAYCIANCSDIDGDGFLPVCGGGIAPYIDCNAKDPSVYPGAPELCDWKDNDCDKVTDEDQPDLDNDGYPACHGRDCNDADAAIFPGAAETPFDGVDQDCNGYDLTIKVTKASYSPEQHGALHVRATSSLGEGAWLYVDYYGSMHWEPKKGYWEIVTTWIGDNPGTVRVCGYEGCVDTPVVK